MSKPFTNYFMLTVKLKIYLYRLTFCSIIFNKIENSTTNSVYSCLDLIIKSNQEIQKGNGAISTLQLHTLLYFYLVPIKLIVY